MARYQVQAPDGHTYEFEAPDDATPAAAGRDDARGRGHYAKTIRSSRGSRHRPTVVGKQFVDATKNDVAGIAQGVAALPDMAATAVGKVASVVPTRLATGWTSSATKAPLIGQSNNVTLLRSPIRSRSAMRLRASRRRRTRLRERRALHRAIVSAAQWNADLGG
jgi:hypothetical protein